MLSKHMSKLNMKALVGAALVAAFAASSASAATCHTENVVSTSVAAPVPPVARPGHTGPTHPAPEERQVICSPEGHCIVILEDGTEIDM